MDRMNAARRGLPFCLGVLGGLVGSLWAAAAVAGTVRIELAYQSPQAVRLSYTVPAGVRVLDLWQRDESAQLVWRDMLSSDDGCGRIEGGQLLLKPGCRQARFTIRPASLNRDATYEAAQPLGTQGVLLHNAFYLATAPGHALQWRWVPPARGTLIHDGRVFRGPDQALVPAAAVTAARQRPETGEAEEALLAKRHVYLGHAPLRALPDGVLVHEPLLDAAREQAIVDMLRTSLTRLRQAYGQGPQGLVAVLPVTEDRPGWHGDTDGHRMMRLQLDRDASRAGSLLNLQQFVAHEAAHWWNAGVFHSDSRRAWLHEGHAEWVALLLTHQAGLRSAREVQEALAQSIGRCQSIRDDTPAAVLPPGRGAGMDAYECGLALWTLAHLQRAEPGDDPLRRLADAHRLAPGLLTEASVADWADKGATGPIHTLLLDEHQGFRSGFIQAWSAYADLRWARRSDELSQGQRFQQAGELMATLMKADCQGQIGFWTLQDAFKLDKVSTCARLKGGQEVTAIAGVRTLESPLEAWAAVNAACAGKDAPLPLTLRSGEVLNLACPAQPYPTPQVPLWQLHPDVQARLGLSH